MEWLHGNGPAWQWPCMAMALHANGCQTCLVLIHFPLSTAAAPEAYMLQQSQRLMSLTTRVHTVWQTFQQHQGFKGLADVPKASRLQGGPSVDIACWNAARARRRKKSKEKVLIHNGSFLRRQPATRFFTWRS